MNLSYEEYPSSVIAGGEEIAIITDFREIIRLLDMLNDTSIKPDDKVYFVLQYFEKMPSVIDEAINALADFITMKALVKKKDISALNDEDSNPKQKNLFSFEFDYPYIFSAFLRDYQINLRTITYMHWWEFKMLFDGLSEDTEIKQRIKYRGTDLNDIKDEQERKQVAKIQRRIALPDEALTDYDIGDALW